MLMHGTSSEFGISRDHIEPDGILLNSLQAYAPTFCIHVNQAIPHNDIRLPTTFNDLLLTPALFNCNYTGMCI